MSQVVAKLRDSFDMVILDTPPSLVRSDAAVLAGQTDGAVVVVRFGKSSRDAVRNAVGSLEQVNAKILGTVLNAIPPSVGAAMAMGTATGTGTGTEETPRQRRSPPRRLNLLGRRVRRGSRRNKCMRALLASFAVGGLFVVVGCGSPTSDPPSNLSASVVTTSNQQDAVFASQLIELSEQLVSITDILTRKRTILPFRRRWTSFHGPQMNGSCSPRAGSSSGGGPPLKHPPPPGLILTEQQQDALIDLSGTELAAAIASSHRANSKARWQSAGRNSGWGEFGGETGGAKLIAQSQAELAVLSQVKVAA